MANKRELNPAYIQGLLARHLIAVARVEVVHFRHMLPPGGQLEASDVYDKLCLVQGELESLLDDLPPSADAPCSALTSTAVPQEGTIYGQAQEAEETAKDHHHL